MVRALIFNSMEEYNQGEGQSRHCLHFRIPCRCRPWLFKPWNYVAGQTRKGPKMFVCDLQSLRKAAKPKKNQRSGCCRNFLRVRMQNTKAHKIRCEFLPITGPRQYFYWTTVHVHRISLEHAQPFQQFNKEKKVQTVLHKFLRKSRTCNFRWWQNQITTVFCCSYSALQRGPFLSNASSPLYQLLMHSLHPTGCYNT